MTDESDTAGTDQNEGGKDTGDDLHGGSEGHASDIPPESPASESGVAFTHRIAERESDSEKDEN